LCHGSEDFFELDTPAAGDQMIVLPVGIDIFDVDMSDPLKKFFKCGFEENKGITSSFFTVCQE
jgi:hypothetical protein